MKLPNTIRILILAILFIQLSGRVHGQQSDRLGEAAKDKQANEKVSFNRDIRPILSDKCFQCHGPDEKTREADLRFDVRDSAMDFIEPADVDGSEMMNRILEDDPELQMPPPNAHKPLKSEEIDLLNRWIKQGAEWDEFWAYKQPEEHKTKSSAEGDQWSINWIDVMVFHRLKEAGLKPSPVADPATLVRRVHFDLIGLPPTPDVVEKFVADPSIAAYEKIVMELMKSKHFGERLAMYWLDLVRYADTVGYHGDQDQNVSPYRDWVINAFNDNMPFDQFTREQLAGDLLPEMTQQQQIASGYNRLLQTTHEGGLQPKEYRAIYAADRVRNVSAVWMGATVGCAQCHDHKYDPYTAKDFYAMSAFFADIDDERHFKNGTNALPTRRDPEILVFQDAKVETEYQNSKSKLDEANKALNKLRQSVKKLEKAKEEIPETLVKELKQVESKQKAVSVATRKLEARGAWTMVTKALESPRETRVLPRGNWLDETGPVVQPAVPEFMGKIETDNRPTRLDLANWLTTGESGKLTARVMANRLWYLYMGVGVSRSLEDFGGQGEPPAFPELLDTLALDFHRDWDLKKSIYWIVTSNTYRQSSVASEELVARDPYNQLFGRQSRYRLPAEVIRDSSLAISGLLNVDEIGGKSIKPYQPANYYRHLNFPNRRYSHTTDRSQWRRGVYVHWQRQFLHPTLKALDAPSREECTCERTRSNTPLAALAMLNDPAFVEAARVFAEKIITQSESNTFEDRLEFAFRWAVSRPANEAEIRILRKLYDESLVEFQSNKGSASEVLKIGLAPYSKELDPETLAAWTQVARAIFNLSETISRN